MGKINGILLIYHHPWSANAATIMEHVNAFEQHSCFRVWNVNTELGFPKSLSQMRFAVIVLHYSLFGWLPFNLYEPFYEYVEQSIESYKIAFFQDEYRYWPERADLLNTLGVDSVYTLIEPQYFRETYGKHTNVSKLVYNLPAYVSNDTVDMGKRFFKPDAERTIDIGYRGRMPAYYLGKGAREKHVIGVEFRKRAAHLGLQLDIETEERKRIYGEAWTRFLANCKAVLGVEAGTSVFDIDNVVRPQYAAMCEGPPDISFPDCSFEEVHANLLAPHEDKIYYRTISARHFEAAALHLCQILFEGKYSGILQPMVHYLPLKKDFSNFNEVIKMFKDEDLRRKLTANAYRDLISSGKYAYKKLIDGVDEELLAAGISPEINSFEVQRVTQLLKRSILRQLAKKYSRKYWVLLRNADFPGRSLLKPLVKPLLQRLGI